MRTIDNNNYIIVSNFLNRSLVVFKQQEIQDKSIHIDTLFTVQLDDFMGLRGLHYDEFISQLFVCDEQAACIHVFSLPKNCDFSIMPVNFNENYALNKTQILNSQDNANQLLAVPNQEKD